MSSHYEIKWYDHAKFLEGAGVPTVHHPRLHGRAPLPVAARDQLLDLVNEDLIVASDQGTAWSRCTTRNEARQAAIAAAGHWLLIQAMDERNLVWVRDGETG